MNKKKFSNCFQKIFLSNFMFWGCLLAFSFLLFKDPFSERTLIPNLEPFPDTLHYVTPAMHFFDNGGSFKISREGKGLTPSVPPLYSIVLVPLFSLIRDVRMFYFTNVFLAFASLSFFYLVLKKTIQNRWIVGFSLFLYITNYFIYWYPSLAMAENLLLTLFLAGIYLLVSEISARKIFLAGLIPLSLYATKYSAVPLTIIFPVVYFIKIVSEREKTRHYLSFFALGLGFSSLLFFSYQHFAVGINNFGQLANFLFSVLPKSKNATALGNTIANSLSWFSVNYFHKNLPLYLGAIQGKSMTFLWDFTPIVTWWVGRIGLLGIFLGFFKKNFRLFSLLLASTLFGQIFFISTFYAADARYIYNAIPTLIFGFAILFVSLLKIFKTRNLKFIFYVFLAGLFIFYLVTNTIRFKKQIMLNLRYAETPWYYISVKKFNEFFTPDKVVNGKKPILISALVPYFVDFYSNGNYSLLPLSPEQEFRSAREMIWGPNDYSDLPKLYRKYLADGRSAYVERYGVGNEDYLYNDFKIVEENFKLTEVATGCYQLCNIYKVELKN